MKKLMTVLLSMVLVFGFSTMTIAFAPQDAQLEVGINIAPYAEFGIVTDFFTDNSGEILKGLFSGIDVTQPGLYVSDGGATEDAAIGYFGLGNNYASINPVDTSNVEMIVVAANTDTVLSMESDFAAFLDANDDPLTGAALMFRFSSNDDILDVHDGGDGAFLPSFVAGDDTPFADVDHYNNHRWATAPYDNINNLNNRGTLTNNTMSVLNTAAGLTGTAWDQWGTDQIISSLNAGNIAEIEIPFRQCTPSLVHVNGALLLEKATAMEAGIQNVTIDFTLSSAQ